jgi:hypothetical protein
MEELGVRYGSRMNQYFKFGMPSTSQGGRRYVKWPEAKEWMEAYVGAGKGKAGIGAANAQMEKLGVPVGETEKPWQPPKPGKLMSSGSAMKELGIKHHSRLSAYKKHGMPTEKDPVTGKEMVKFPEAKLWYDTYVSAGKGKVGIEAANQAVGSRSKGDMPKPPKPPKEPKQDALKYEERGKIKRGDKLDKDALQQGARLTSDPSIAEVSGTRQANIRASLEQLPSSHLDTIKSIVHREDFTRDPHYTPEEAKSVGAYYVPPTLSKDGRGAVVLNGEYTRNLRWQSSRMMLTHEVGHGVHHATVATVNSYQARNGWARPLKQARASVSAQGEAITGKSAAGRKLLGLEINRMWKGVTKGTRKTVTSYAKKNQMEFFAESYAYYVHNPRRLRRVDREMFDFLRVNVFQGAVYVDNN